MTRFALAIAGAVFVLGACATTDSDAPSSKEAFLAELMEDPRVGEEVDRICFTGNIDGFGNTTKRSVVVSVSPTRDYVITTFTRCSDLDHAQSLAFDDFGACLSRGDKILPFSSAFGPSSADAPILGCQVDKIYEWDKDAEAEAEEDEAEEPETQET
ncbi:MAG: DUF6491 family protein [Hyphomonadaceae bacterium]|nr:DUF6491 family protein [Hyphomonadaceae bacterium]